MDISNEELERRMRGFAKFIEANVNGTQLVGFSTKIETATQRQHLMRRLAKTNDPKNIELLEIEMAKNYEAENTDQEKVFYIKVFGRTLATLKTRMSVLEAVSKDFPYEQVVGKLKLIDIEQKIVGNR
jgi:CRISPR/Cas system-associated endoribonuclease Cas2